MSTGQSYGVDRLVDQVPPRLGESGDRQDRVLSVSGKKRCSHCKEELGKLPYMFTITITITMVTINMVPITMVTINNIPMMINLVKLIITGRGAAMIIESLRLFYHIRCFKCCVCRLDKETTIYTIYHYTLHAVYVGYLVRRKYFYLVRRKYFYLVRSNCLL